MIQDPVVVDVLGSVVAAMRVAGISDMSKPGASNINYEPGRNIQIMKSLNDLDNSISYKGNKYPLIGVVLPIPETHSSGFLTVARVPRIVIAMISNSTDDVFTRYQTGGTFKSILYPCYREFMKQLTLSPRVVGNDPDLFKFTKLDSPGSQPVGQGVTDYVDTIEILNLEIILNKIKNCN